MVYRRNPRSDFAEITAVVHRTGEWPGSRTHPRLYNHLRHARLEATQRFSYPELAELLDDACPRWREDAFTRTKQRAINSAIAEGRSPASTDTDENLPLRDHDRAQIEELVGNFIAQIVIIIHNLRPLNDGFTR